MASTKNIDELASCISRQAAIDAIEDHIKAYTSTMDGYNMARRHMKELLEVLPSAQPQWIPVVEDLPKEEGYFFVTDEAAGMAETLIDKYIRCDDGEWVWLYSQHVVAWMPLPEPYKVGEK